MITKYKPTSPGRRGQTKLVSRGGKVKPKKRILKRLSIPLKGTVGRSHGRISVFQRCRGAKKRYRLIDFRRDKYDIPAKVEAIEYDPVRTCEIALLLYTDGERRYILAPADLKIGDIVVSGEKVTVSIGNSLPLGNIPVGMQIHNIEMYPKAGGKFVRGAGGVARITAKEGKYVNVRMPSREVRKFLSSCYATIGQLSNEEHKLVKLGKAGRAYHLGRRPKTRGKARSDGHPHSGSYSRRVGRQPVDKWGNLSKGGITRKRKHTDKYIVRSRKKK